MTARILAVAIPITAGGLAGYAAKQSGHHRGREDQHKRLELELSTFGRYTELLQEPDDARKAYAERLFLGAELGKPGEAALTKDHVNLIQTLIETPVLGVSRS